VKPITRRNVVKAAAGLVAFLPAARSLAFPSTRVGACPINCSNVDCVSGGNLCAWNGNFYELILVYNCYDACDSQYLCYTEKCYTCRDCYNGYCYCGSCSTPPCYQS